MTNDLQALHAWTHATYRAKDLKPNRWWWREGGIQKFMEACAHSIGTLEQPIIDAWEAEFPRSGGYDFSYPDLEGYGAPGDEDEAPVPRQADADRKRELRRVVQKRQHDAVRIYLQVTSALQDEEAATDPQVTTRLRDRLAEVASLPSRPDDAAARSLYGLDHVLDVARRLLWLRMEAATGSSVRSKARVAFPTVRPRPVLRYVCAETLAEGPADEGASVFLAAEQAFLPLGPAFCQALVDAPEAMRQSVASPLTSPCRIRIEDLHEGRFRPTSDLLTGPSVGGAAAVAVWSAQSETPVERNWLVSFSTRSVPEASVDGKIHRVGSLDDKRALASPGTGLLFCGRMDGEVGLFASDPRDLAVRRRAAPGTESLSVAFDLVAGSARDRSRYLAAVDKRIVKDSFGVATPTGDKRPLPDIYVQVRIARRRIDLSKLERPMDGAVPQDRPEDIDYLRGATAELEAEELPVLMPWPDFARGGDAGAVYLRRGVILGDPGFGKSWLLRSEARRLAIAARDALGEDGNNAALPVLLTLTELADFVHDAPDIPAAIVQAVRKSYGGADVPESVAADIREALEDPALIDRGLGDVPQRVVLLLDSLDEVPSGNEERLSRLWGWISKRPGLAVWVTSRSVGYRGVGEWSKDLLQPDPAAPSRADHKDVEVELCAFTDRQQREFVRKWFGESARDERAADASPADSRAADLLDAISNSPQLQGMAQVPLLLTFLCIRAESGATDLASETRASLYAGVVRDMLHQEFVRRFGALDEDVEELFEDWVDETVDKLRPAAFSLFSGSTELFTVTQLKAPFVQQQLDGDRGRAQGMVDIWFDVDDFVENRSRLKVTELPLVASVNPGDEDARRLYRFIHRTFHEYFAGGFLAQVINTAERNEEEQSSAGWDHEIHAWQEILNEDGLPKEIEDGDYASAWRRVQVPLWKFVAKKAWDPRYKQPLLFLAGQLTDDDDRAELLDIVAFGEGRGEEEGEKDDLFRHRLALAAQMVPEIVPEGIESWDDYDLGENPPDATDG